MKPIAAFFALWLGLAAASIAAENQVVLNLEPSAENPRNSEGSFVTLKSGRILFYYSQFYGGRADNSPARIAEVHSDDQGRTWSTPMTVVENAAGNNVMSVSLLRLKSGRLAFFHIIKNSWLDCRPWLRISSDEGATWSEPKQVIEAPGYFVLNNDRVIQTSTGRLLVPVAFHRARAADPASGRTFDARAIAMWFYSDDEGATWKEADNWWAIPAVSRSGLQEPGVVELANKKILSWTRTDQGSQYGFASADNGKTWSAPVPVALQSPQSPASIKRLPGTTDLLAIYNDHSGEFPFPKGKRTPLVSAISSDGGKTWQSHKLIEGDPDGWYCYTAIHIVDGAVLLGYCAGDSKVGGLNRLRIRRVGVDWLRGK
ncbi:MAG: exo-alpha-sialidase [Verrucomicrobia bacterium]|nr:exo-alpha-sialidase [Verrucomicrobiota bacterium]